MGKTIPQQLRDCAREIAHGQEPPPVTVRDFLGWFDAKRRGYTIVREIREALAELGLRTDPDFELPYIGSAIRVVANAEGLANVTDPTTLTPASDVSHTPENLIAGGTVADPMYRIGKLEAANRPPVSVAPDTPLDEVATIMVARDFSQVVVATGPRDVKGVVSWSSIGARLALGISAATARAAMDPHQEISADRSLFAAIATIGQYGYVLVRDRTTAVSGIVTSADLGTQFRQLAEPFLLIGEIENQIRTLLDGKFTAAELSDICDPTTDDRRIERVSDLTFGEYVRLLENPARWEKVGIRFDRVKFVDELQEVRRIRNDVMHFDPDGLPLEDLLTLQRVARFLQYSREIGAVGEG